MNKSSIAAMLLTTPNLTVSGAIALQKEDNNMKVRKPVRATRRVTAPHKAPFTPPFTTTKQLTEQTTKPAYVNVGTSGHVDHGKTPIKSAMTSVKPAMTSVKPTMTLGTRKSLEELLERAIAYQTELAVRYHVPIGLPFPDAQILLDALNTNRKTIAHFQNALKEG